MHRTSEDYFHLAVEYANVYPDDLYELIEKIEEECLLSLCYAMPHLSETERKRAIRYLHARACTAGVAGAFNQ